MRVTYAFLGLAALALAGCASTGAGNFAGFGGTSSRPRTIIVSDFVFSSDVVALDRGFTARLTRKIGTFPPHERRQRTAERVNDEIVATIVVALREAGLDAQPGSEEGLSLSDDALVVTGRLRAVDESNQAQRKEAGFGTGRSGVVADMTASRVSGGGKRQVLSFTAAAQGGKRAASGKAENAAIAAVTVQGGASEKLSADVEAQARAIGHAAAEKIVAYAKEQGWLTKPAEATAPTS
jgi:hypothetical protein